MASKDMEEVEEIEVEEGEEEEVTELAGSHPCPTCGLPFSEIEMREKHARFCLPKFIDAEPGTEWTDDRIFLLIDFMHSRYKKFIHLSPKQRKQHWKWAAKVVGATGEETRNRWNNLIACYNRVRIALAQGRQRGTNWRFFGKMNQILGSDAVNRAEFVLSSMPLDMNEDGSVQPHTGMLLPTEGDGDLGSNDKLINLMDKNYNKFSGMSAKERKQFWREVAEELSIPAEEARIRWNMLVGSFKRTKIHRSQFVARHGREPRNKWRFLDQMERIVGSHLNSTLPLMVLSSRQPPPASGFPLATGANLLTASKPLVNIAPAPPRPAATAAPVPAPAATATSAAGQPSTGVFQLGPNGLLQPVPQDKLPSAAAAAVQATTLPVSTPPQQPADTDAFATKRKALFVEDYLRAKARREEQRLQLEERRIKALEKLVDVMEARGGS